MAVKEQRQLSLFGTKISFSMAEDDEDRAELTKSAEEIQGSNVDDLSSFSASTSGSEEDEKLAAQKDKSPPPEKAKAAAAGEENGSSFATGLSTDEQQQGDGRGSAGRGCLKRPDKPVPCPRCNSLDTKFCYFNNYNVNQPRHFCKNCQRYWTAGGTLRNVPVGAGRRKNKSHAKGGGDDVNPPGEKKVAAGRIPRKEVPSTACSKEGAVSSTSEATSNDSRDDSTCGSSVSNPETNSSQYAAVTAGGWPYSGGTAGCWQGFPWPAPVWGWNTPWNTPWGNLAATAARALADNVGTLGKHLREDISDSGSLRGPLWAPKTLRIDAQGGDGSSFLADIGSGSNKVETISTGGMFKAFQHECSKSSDDQRVMIDKSKD